MNDDGVFRRKKGFTITGNNVIRDNRLSMKAIGLYVKIMSYITLDDFVLEKSFIMSKCREKQKAFDSAWKELKERGYLKSYFYPTSKGWKAEYELLDEPNEEAHTYYFNAKGELSSTDRDREDKKMKKQRISQNGGNAKNERTPQNGSNAEGSNAKGGNNIKLNNKTKYKTINDNLSFIPYEYSDDKERMTEAIHQLTDWDRMYPSGYEDRFYQQTYNLAVNALIEMVCEKEIQVYNKRKLTYADIIDKINQVVSEHPLKNIKDIIEDAVESYMKAANENEIHYPKKYIKSCIVESFDTYYVKFASMFNRTFYG